MSPTPTAPTAPTHAKAFANGTAAGLPDADQLRRLNPWPGRPYPLGATYDGKGVNFAIFSERASGVDLCLFLPDDPSEEVVRITLTEQTDYVYHAYLPGLKPGLLYGYRVYGTWDPARGQLFNPSKLLIDPYAKAIHGTVEWSEAMFGYPVASEDERRYREIDESDSGPYANKSVVIDPRFDWQGDLLPETHMHESVIYELHVKGMTALHPHIPEEQRGTYKGLAHPKVIEYLSDLGVTAIELMPVHHFVHDQHLADKGLRNYWGYNSLGFFAPHSEYSCGQGPGAQVTEFKEMVRAYHRAGLEVILDVVYNHTAEGNHYGPTLSFKGIDNQSYYRLVDGTPEYYMDYTGTGNTLNMLHPRVLQLVMDSLRYWVTEMHVDGFRFDLASALARGLFEVGKLSTFLDTIHQDPIISQVKLIAEPWDVGPGGYQVGNFPVLWTEWNGKYRDCVRDFWRGEPDQIGEFASRISGSSDLYQHNGRAPWSSINFVTAHDGFTLRDLVSYNEKHNLANGEGNRDGESSNESWNCGAEGPTDDAVVLDRRRKQQRNFLATMLLSQGVPMVVMGDEYGRTQLGNNNGYCQDNPVSYFAWDWTEEQGALHDFVKGLIRLRMENPVLHRRKFFSGRASDHSRISDIFWVRADGQEMTPAEWDDGNTRTLGMVLNGEAMTERDVRGRPIRDDIFLVIVNAYWDLIPFTLPGNPDLTDWRKVVDTDAGDIETDHLTPARSTYDLPPRSLATFVRIDKRQDRDRRKPWLVQMGRPS